MKINYKINPNLKTENLILSLLFKKIISISLLIILILIIDITFMLATIKTNNDLIIVGINSLFLLFILF